MTVFKIGHTGGIGHFIKRNIDRCRQMTFCKFNRFANVQHYQVFVKWNIHHELIRLYVDDYVRLFITGFPGFITPLKVPLNLVEPNPRQANNAFLLLSRITDEQKWRFKRKKTASPFRKSAVKANANGSRDKSFRK